MVGTFVYWTLLHFTPSALAAVLALSAAVVVLVNPCWAMITAYINERFHTGIRASGFGLGYSLAVIIPSFYAFYQSLLGHVMSETYTVLPLLVVGGLLITLGGAMGPETRDVDLGGDVTSRAPERDREPRFERAPAGAGASSSPARAGVAMGRAERVR